MFFYTFFPRILNMSLTAAVAIAAILPVRLLLKRAPKVISYALWGVVLIRLLCPVALPSGLSLFGLMDAPVAPSGGIEYISPDIVHTEHPAVALPVPGVSEAVNSVLPQGEEQLVADPLEAPMAIATYVWMAGMAAMAVYAAASYIRLRRNLVTASPLEGNIYLVDGIASPFVMGLIRPKIYLPSGLAEAERGYIIMHERHHIRRGDHIFKALGFAALCVHWFNPLVWAAFILAGRDMEMSCDEAVVRKLGDGILADYSASLLSLATGKRVIAGMPLAFGEGDPKGRIRNLAAWRKPSFWVIIAAVAAVILLAAALLTNPGAGRGKGGGFKDVLLGREPFSYAAGGQMQSLYIGDVPALFDKDDPYMAVWDFSAVDLDGDGEREAVLYVIGVSGDTGGKLILHSLDGQIYGYAAGNRELEELKTDGTYAYSDPTGLAETGVAAITEFSETGCTVDRISYAGGSYNGPEAFVVDHQPATEEDYLAAIQAQNAKESAARYEFNEENIESVF